MDSKITKCGKNKLLHNAFTRLVTCNKYCRLLHLGRAYTATRHFTTLLSHDKKIGHKMINLIKYHVL